MKNVYKIVVGIAIVILVFCAITLISRCKSQSYNSKPCNMWADGRN